MSDYGCFESVLRNVSGGTTRISGFGLQKRLINNQIFTIPGTPGAWIAANHSGIKARRLLNKLHSQIDHGTLRVESIPTAPCGDVWDSSSSMFVPVVDPPGDVPPAAAPGSSSSAGG